MAARRACRLAGGEHGVAERLCGPCDPLNSCAILFFVNRSLARDKPICCFARAQILEAPWRTKWLRPTRGASTNTVRPPTDNV
eukprot:6175186-Pleurochrysis_carterae.AAC.3